jgi:transposase
MVRLKAIYLSWAIPCAGERGYAQRHPAERLAKITEPGVRRHPELYYGQLDALRPLHQQVWRELVAESKKHSATRLLRQIPAIGPIRAALLIALMQTPHRFRTKRPLWADSGLALKTYTSNVNQFLDCPAIGMAFNLSNSLSTFFHASGFVLVANPFWGSA